MTSPRVSVVLPTFGRPRLLRRAIDSVCAQTVRAWELWVVDDNPPWGQARAATRALLASIDDPRVRYLAHAANRGGSAARNTGIRHARAPWIAFLDDDDVWLVRKLERQLAVAERTEADVAMVYCGFERRFDDGRARAEIPSPRPFDFGQLLAKNRIGGTSAVMCRKAALTGVGGFDERLASKQDIDLYLRLCRRHRTSPVPEVLFLRHHHAGTSVSKRLEGRLRAHAYFERKYAAELRAHPRAHHELEKARVRLLLEARRRREARHRSLGCARRAPWDWGVWSLAFRSTALGEALRAWWGQRNRDAPVGTPRP